MIYPLIALAVAGLSAASPLAIRSQYPPTSTSQGFVLVANVTDLSKDFSPSINHWKLEGVHVGAGLDTAVLSEEGGRIWFENATLESGHYIVNSSLITDGGLYPYGLSLTPLSSDTPDSDYVDYVGVNIGTGSREVGIRPFPVPYPEVYTTDRGTFVVCYEPNPAYGRPPFPVRFAKSHFEGADEIQPIPDGCVPINLLAQCATLPPVQDGAEYNHDSAQTVSCYDDVASIDWSQYAQW